MAERGSDIRSGDSVRLLIVGWYPSADDPFAGRFVADQAAALKASGAVRPDVLSFEPFWLHGDARMRSSTAAAWPALARRAIREDRLFISPAAESPADIPVARLAAPAGRTILAGADNEARHRGAALAHVLDDLDGRGSRWQLVHAHVGYPDGAAVAIAARRRLPFVLTEHATYLARLWADPVVRSRYLAGARAARRIVAVSRVLATQIETEFPELRGRVVVIPNTVDVRAFTPTGPDARDPDELLWVGYRREVKGMPNLLRAFAIVRSRRPSTRLRLVGRSTSTEEEAGWQAMAAELGIADAVRFEGPASRAGVAAAMERAALFVHPSRVETMGVVAVEALAAGLPVVATDSGGVTEVLGAEPSRLGALVPADEPSQLAEAILGGLDRRTTFDPAALRAAVETRFGAPAVAARLVGLYREVLSEASARRAMIGRGPRPWPDGASTTGRASTPAARPRALAGFEGRVLVVAFDYPHVERLRLRFPRWVVDGLTLVSLGGLSSDLAAAALPDPERARQVAAYLHGGLSPVPGRFDLRDRLRTAPAAIRRLRNRSRLDRLVQPILVGLLDEGLDRVGATIERPALLVCVGGIDVFLSRAAVASGRAVLAPGGLRWLADARWVDSVRDR